VSSDLSPGYRKAENRDPIVCSVLLKLTIFVTIEVPLKGVWMLCGIMALGHHTDEAELIVSFAQADPTRPKTTPGTHIIPIRSVINSTIT
jgi:hypothetical protein